MSNISTYQHDYYPRTDMKRIRLRPIQEVQHLSGKQSSVSDPTSIINTKSLTTINQCLINKPNRYLLNLRRNNSSIYKKLKVLTPTDVDRSRDFLKSKSTYQIDYGHAKEWLEGVYS